MKTPPYIFSAAAASVLLNSSTINLVFDLSSSLIQFWSKFQQYLDIVDVPKSHNMTQLNSNGPWEEIIGIVVITTWQKLSQPNLT
jgi:hypothetical protein